MLVLLPIAGLLRIVVPACWEGAGDSLATPPERGVRGAIANDSIDGKGLVLEVAVQPQPRWWMPRASIEAACQTTGLVLGAVLVGTRACC